MGFVKSDRRLCASCNGLKCLIFGGPDGAYTLCNICHKFYSQKRLRLYRTSSGVSARAAPGAERVTVKRFKPAVHNRDQCNRMNPVVRIASKIEHQQYPLPSDKDHKMFILRQAALVDGDEVMEESESNDEDESEEDEDTMREDDSPDEVNTEDDEGEEEGDRKKDEDKREESLGVRVGRKRRAERRGGRVKLLRRMDVEDLVQVKVECVKRGMEDSVAEKRRLVFRKGMDWDDVHRQLVDTSICFNVDGDWFVTYSADDDWTLLQGSKDLAAFFEYAQFSAKTTRRHERRALVKLRIVESSNLGS